MNETLDAVVEQQVSEGHVRIVKSRDDSSQIEMYVYRWQQFIQGEWRDVPVVQSSDLA